MIDYIFELARRDAEVQRNYSGPNLWDSIVQLEVAVTVEGQDRNPVASAEPHSGQAGRQSVDPLADVAKRVPDRPTYYRLLIGGVRYRSPQAIQNGPGHNFSSSN